MKRQSGVEYVDFELDDLRQRLNASPMTADDKSAFGAVLDTLAMLTRELERNRISVSRLRRILFGPSSEKMNKLCPPDAASPSGAPPSEPDSDASNADASSSEANDEGHGNPEGKKKNEAKKRKGHGRLGASDYPGAEHRDIPHGSLAHGDPCPACCQGKVYEISPERVVRLHGASPVSAVLAELARLRCGTCGEIFVADMPDDLGNEKYDEGTKAIVTLLKYGTGMPFNRLARLQGSAGVPLPASTQWQLCEQAARQMAPVFHELVLYAAQAGLLHIDDTGATILGPVRRPGVAVPPVSAQDDLVEGDSATRPEDRTGTYTSGIVGFVEDHVVVLYFTGWRHAGDNLERILVSRSPGLGPPIQMCDALSRNASGDFITLLANCLAHGRREFVDLLSRFKEPCRHVIKQLATVFYNDKQTRDLGLSPDERLAYHQKHSGPVMEALKAWMKAELDERRVEPNSPLGSAFNYMENHWEELTLFLRVAGAPLDNNICERILKLAILNRKNAYFFRTQRGACVADICMSLIQTAQFAKKNALDYLTKLLEHHDDVAANPDRWLPWNYEQSVAELCAVAA